MQRGYFKGKVLHPKYGISTEREVAILERNIKKTRKLTNNEKINVVHDVIVNREETKYVSRKYKVRPYVV